MKSMRIVLIVMFVVYSGIFIAIGRAIVVHAPAGTFTLSAAGLRGLGLGFTVVCAIAGVQQLALYWWHRRTGRKADPQDLAESMIAFNLLPLALMGLLTPLVFVVGISAVMLMVPFGWLGIIALIVAGTIPAITIVNSIPRPPAGSQ